MNHACPHCQADLKGRLVGHRHINALRVELVCPSCTNPIAVNKSAMEIWIQPLIWLPGIPLFKLWLADEPPLWAWILTGILAAFSILAGYYLWKNHLKDWPRYARAGKP